MLPIRRALRCARTHRTGQRIAANRSELDRSEAQSTLLLPNTLKRGLAGIASPFAVNHVETVAMEPNHVGRVVAGSDAPDDVRASDHGNRIRCTPD